MLIADGFCVSISFQRIIYYDEIVTMKKRTTALIFQNAIEFFLEDEKVTTSMLIVTCKDH